MSSLVQHCSCVKFIFSSKKRRSTGKGAKSRTPSDKLKADRAKRAEQRQKLKEKMMAAKKLKKRRSSGKLRSRSCDAN